jgi:Secretion system C-terminal sorting domain
VYADTIYRLNGEIHSCTQGINGSVAMCIGTQDVCDPRKLDFTKALKIGFSINPSQVGQITHLSFYERSPLQYSWINGATGINNFVDKYAIRISKNGKFVYQQYDIASSRNWLKKSFDFTNIPNFKTQDSAYYLVEIVPYCRVNNGSDISVWDIDQVEVFGGCCEGNTNDVTSYVWSNGNTGSSINVTPTNNTIYTVTATDCCGCKATKDVRVLISNLQLDAGENKTITLGQQALITPSVQSLSGCFEIELKFRWSNGATTKNISVSPTSNTTYYLSVEDCHGCVYEDSISVNVTSNKLVTFPNPARDQITVVGPVVENSLLKIRLLRMDGQLILKRNIDIVQNDAINFELDLPDSLTSGAYILEVDNGFNVDRSIIVVQK